MTLGPLEPEIYSYGFNVDGMTVDDQRTSYVKPSSSYTSLEVPGDGPQFYDSKPVPHGDLRIVMYEAKTLEGRARRMRVYTPPMPSIFQQEALGGRRNGGGPGRGSAQPAGQDDAFTKELLGDIMPLVQKRYRILTGPDNTAIAGLSLGGAQTLRSGLAHVDTFHYIVALSAAVGMGGRRGAAPAAGAGGAAAPAGCSSGSPGGLSGVDGRCGRRQQEAETLGHV